MEHIQASEQLERSLGARDVALLTIGSVIGSGIFFVPGTVLASAGGSLYLSYAAWIFGGLMALAGALTFAEIGARRPEAGGLYIFIRDAFGPAPAFLFGWSMILAVAGGTVATLAVAFGDTIQRLLDLSPTSSKLIAIAAIIVLAILNFGNAKITALLQGASGVLKAAILIAIAALIFMVTPVEVRSVTTSSPTSPSISAMIAALVGVLWAYEGWHTITYCAGEMKEPGRVLPRGFLFGVASLVLIYLFVNAACAYALGAQGLAVSTQPVADALTAAGQPALANFVRIFVGFSILGAAHASLFTDSRVVYAMSKDGLFFSGFAKISPESRTPRRAIVAIALSAIGLTLFNAFDALLELVVVSSWFFIGLAGVSIFIFRAREGAPVDTFRVPFYPILPALFIISSVLLVSSSWITGGAASRYGLIVMVLGWIVFLAWTRFKSKEAV
jgi:basic amino acid/polyamine antiporter, APA family